MKSVFLAKTSPYNLLKIPPSKSEISKTNRNISLSPISISNRALTRNSIDSKISKPKNGRAKIFEGQKSRGAARSRWGDELIDSLARRGLYVNSFVNRNEFEYWFPAGRLDRGLGRGEASPANAICSWRRFAASVICTTMLRQLREARPSFNLLWLEFRRRSIVGRMDGWMDRRGERWWKEWGAERAHCLSRNAEGRLFHRATLSPPLNSRINNRRRVFASHFFRENNALDKERNLLLLPSTVSYKFL